MSAKRIADFIFEGTGKGVNALMRKFGLSKSATAKLTPNQLARVIQQKGTQFYKDTDKAKNIDTGKIFYGATSAGAILSKIWNEFDPAKVKKMGDGTLRADERKKIGKSKSETVTPFKKKVVKKTPPKAPPPKPNSIKKNGKNGQQYMKDKSGKDTNVKFNYKGGMLKKRKK